MTDKQIFDVLGIEKGNRSKNKHLLKEFRYLISVGYLDHQIWLKGDLGVYAQGEPLLETYNLVVL